MVMPRASEAWTAAAVRAIPEDGKRYELIDGELVVTPAPAGRHQRAVLELIRRLDSWLLEQGTAWLLMSPADISLGEDEILQPDVFVYRTATGHALQDWSDITSLVLVIEVLSPSTARYDRHLKRRRYQRAGVPEYWIVDLDGRVVERWGPDDQRPEVLTNRLQWTVDPSTRARLDIDLPSFFTAVLGEA